MINTLKELKSLTNNLIDFSKINLTNINPILISNVPQEQKNLWFVQKAQLAHGDKYDYSKIVYTNSKIKVEIICSTHGSFFQNPNSHSKGVGCLKCGTIKHSNSNRKRVSDFVKDAAEVHKSKYNYSKVNYINICTKVEIICPIHGSFLQTPSGHLSGDGCKQCGYNSSNVKLRSNSKNFIQKATKLHKNKYNYSKVNYVNDMTKVEIICPTHGSFFQKPKGHLQHKGCSKCNSSKGELHIFKILEDNNVKFESQWNFNKHRQLKGTGTSYLQFDFFLPDYNLAIEYDGEQHFKSVKQWSGKDGLLKTQQRDQLKNQFCLDNNIRLLRIPYWTKPTEELILHHLNKNFTIISSN